MALTICLADQAMPVRFNWYYYLVFGNKDGAEKIELLKVSKADVDNEVYSHINFEHIAPSAVTEYCKMGLSE